MSSNASQSFTATAGQTEFPFSFPYLAQADLTVSIDGKDLLNDKWSLLTPQTLKLGDDYTGGGALQGGDLVRIYRTTPIDNPLVSFASPSTLRSAEINLAILQLLYNLQEQDETTVSTLGADSSGTKWLAESLPIKDLGAPVDGTDAARLSDILDAIVTSGGIPAFSIADVGRALSINPLGNVGWQSPGGGVSTFRVVPQTSGAPAGASEGFALAKNTATRTPVEKVADILPWWSGASPSVSGDFDIVLPSSGVYEVTVQARLRSIPTGANYGVSLASLSLMDSLGTQTFDTSPLIRMGMDSPDTGFNASWQGTSNVTLSAIITVNGTLSLNLWGHRGNEADVVLDVPSTVTVKELR